MYRLRVVSLITIALISASTACRKESVDDQSLTTGIKANLFSDPTTKSANVNVDVKDGVATLTGDVPSSDIESQVVKIATATAGVKKVNDQIKVNSALAMNPSATATPNAQTSPAPVAQPEPEPPSGSPTPQSAQPQEPATSATSSEPPNRTRPEHRRVTIPAGEQVAVRMIDSIDSSRNVEGQVFRASLYSPLVSRGRVVVPAGTNVGVVLTRQTDAGRVRGRSGLEVRLSRLEYHGRTYPLVSTLYEEQGNSRGKQTATRTGIGAAAGAVIGAIAGGGKGAAIGSAVGGGGAAGYQLFTRGEKVKIPSESIINFRLQAPVTIDTAPGRAVGRER